ncbi:MAG: translocase [Planctomycetota bacterium]|nr:translocase [Planctomycetaceae bacterium]MDQ3329362.1 translocase [Planctomycetota bacterium]
MPGLTSLVVHSVAGGFRPSSSRLSRWRAEAKRIIRLSETFRELSDHDLHRRGSELRWKAKSGTTLRSLLPEAYALVRESSRRTKGMSHFPVQVMGAIALFEGHIAEMQTGEGKTLTAVPAGFLRALVGKGCHVVTVNDYLAKRDAEHMGPIYEALGVSVGVILTDMEPDERRENYAKDVTYGTAKEFGFDFLRDRLRKGAEEGDVERTRPFGTGAGEQELPVQRGHYFALVDEADSVLVDEARTPLIIGLTRQNDPATVNLLRWSRLTASKLERNSDFLFKPDRREARLTDHGCRKVLLTGKPKLIEAIDMEKIYETVEKLLVAQHGFVRDRDYVIVEDKIVIVDESTGRTMDGRKWQDGLHQAVEAKERIPITALTGQAARITVQAFFRRYQNLAGMTGTAWAVRGELKKTYSINVSVIPTNRPCIRKGLKPRVFRTLEAKWRAVAEETERLSAEGRAVLIGTPSVEASEALAEKLATRGIRHEVLNARYPEKEAEIVSRAGRSGAVMIATNMAGRGTDILLDDVARKTGGLHVVATEMHSASRIDRQLVGRAARQGDPGSYQFFLSLEDELLRFWPPEKRLRWLKQAGTADVLDAGWVKRFKGTQRTIERQHRKQRKEMLKHEKQRTQSYAKMGLDPYLELTE